MRKILYLLVVLPLFCIAQETTTLRIDPDAAMGGAVSQVFDSVTYIPLETTKESLFGEIDRMQVIDDYFLIFDYFSTRSLFVFDKKGKFIGRIKNLPNRKFTIDRKNKIIYVHSNRKFYLYSLNGQLIKTIPFTSNGEIHDYTYISEETIVYISTKVEGNSMLCFLNWYHISDGKSQDVLLASIPFESPWAYNATSLSMFNLFSSLFNPSNNQLFFALRYNYNIYNIGPKTLLSRPYSFVFPASISLPRESSLNTIFTKERDEQTLKNKDIITEIPDFFSADDQIAFSTVANQSAYIKSFYLYSLKTGRLLSLDHINPDSISFFLPLGKEIFASDGHNFYSTVASYKMFNAHKGSKNKKTEYTELLQDYFTYQDRKSNPVIVQLKLKDNL